MPTTSSSLHSKSVSRGSTVQVHAVVRRVLGDDDQLAYAVGRELLGLGDDFLDRLGGVLAAHLRNRTERAEPIAALGNLQVREVLRRDPQTVAVGQCTNRRGSEHGPLLVEVPDQAVGDAGDLFAAEDADEVVDAGTVFEQLLFLSLGQAAGDDHAARAALLLEGQHFVDRRKRLGPGPFDEAARVDDDEIGPVRVAHQVVAVDLQQAQHPLAIDGVFRAAETDEGVRALRVGGRHVAFAFGGHHSRDKHWLVQFQTGQAKRFAVLTSQTLDFIALAPLWRGAESADFSHARRPRMQSGHAILVQGRESPTLFSTNRRVSTCPKPWASSKSLA